jgi:glutamyl-tRNA synthetase
MACRIDLTTLYLRCLNTKVNLFGEVLKTIVRFAPSPTGFLHVGGARTAIFNWLIARKTGGLFLLRIEDTDLNRSTEESVQQILTGLEWLGLDFDDKVYFQSHNKKRHISIVNRLLKDDLAYRCFCTKEEIEEKKKQAIKDKRNLFYDKTCRSLTDEQISEKMAKNIPFSVRFKTPNDGETSYDDIIHGSTSVQNNTIEDFIILRSDGNPIYQIAVVADDHDMSVNLVMRGDDHISNTPKQILIYKALNWEVPKFAHIPLILGEDKVRLSKRHGATSIEEFKEQGILADALFNYLCLLGWAPGDDSEQLSKSSILQKFTIPKINNRPAVFDFKKLQWMNGKYFADLSEEKINQIIEPWLKNNNLSIKNSEQKAFNTLVKLQQTRANTSQELVESLMYYFEDPLSYDKKGVKKYLSKKGADNLLNMLLAFYLKQNESYFEDTAKLETDLRTLAEENGVSAAKIIHPLRLALTGKTASPGIFEIISILGKDKVLKRIENAINYIIAQNWSKDIEA